MRTTKSIAEKAIRAEIRELRAYMKENGIRRTSCFNGGLSQEEWRCNSRLFALTVKLQDEVKCNATA